MLGGNYWKRPGKKGWRKRSLKTATQSHWWRRTIGG
jgi:hypothetical protein